MTDDQHVVLLHASLVMKAGDTVESLADRDEAGKRVILESAQAELEALDLALKVPGHHTEERKAQLAQKVTELANRTQANKKEIVGAARLQVQALAREIWTKR